VPRATLKLGNAYDAWAPFVRQGRLQRASGGETAVLVRVLEGRKAAPDSLAELREDGRLLARLQHECVLRVEQTSGVGGLLALVHENFDCVAMHHVIAALRARGQVLPSRVAVEIAAGVGVALEEALKISDGERRLIHPGTTPAEVLVDTAGRVKLAGVTVLHGATWPTPPAGYGAPEGAGGWQAATWMVGALLVELLTGEPPPEGSKDAAKHEQALRRLVMRLLARPGDTPGELLVQAVRQSLAHEADQRGTPGAFGRMLRDLAVQLQTPGLRAWAPGTIPAVQRHAGGRASTPASRTLAPASAGQPLPEPPLAPPPSALRPQAEPLPEDPEPTRVDTPVPALRHESAAPPPAPAVRSPRVEAPAETRPVPSQVLRSGPSVTSRSSARPIGPPVGPAPAPTPAPALLPLAVHDDESEQTVVARPLSREEPKPKTVDPLLVPVAHPAPAAGPAPVARQHVEVTEEEPARRSMVPLVLGGLTAFFAAGSLVLVAAMAWYMADGTPETEAVPTLADVVGEPDQVKPDGAVAPVAPAPAEAAPVVPAPAPAPPEAPPPAPAPAPARTTEPPKAPAPAASAPAPKAPTAAQPTAASRAPAAPRAAAAAPESKAGESTAPVRIGTTTTAPPETPAATAPSPAASAAPAAPAAAPPADPGPFSVNFRAADAGWTLEVKCMAGGGSGASVSVPEAPRGNCRVVGRNDATTVMTLVTVTAPRDYTCFAGGTRTCR
jgi:outer membrane biosynthesis protein TonB